MVERVILPEKAIFGWRCYFGVEFPSEDQTETVVFRSFYEKGLVLPAWALFRGILHFYGLEVTHLKPNSIA
jgi:hypothetical protein